MENWKGAEPHFLTYRIRENLLCFIVHFDDVMLDSLRFQLISESSTPCEIHVATIRIVCYRDRTHLLNDVDLVPFSCVVPLRYILETISHLGIKNRICESFFHFSSFFDLINMI